MQLFRLVAPVAVFSGLLLLSPLKAQQPAVHAQYRQDQAMPQRGATMNVDKMLAEMKASDAKVEALTMRMKSAQGEAKVLAMQDVVDELVRNQLETHRRFAMMHQQ